MNLDPIRFLQRRQRFNAAVNDEVALFARRYGNEAAVYAAAKLERDDLTTRYRRVLYETVRRLRR